MPTMPELNQDIRRRMEEDLERTIRQIPEKYIEPVIKGDWENIPGGVTNYVKSIRWGMVINSKDKCGGCKACTVACASEYKHSEDVESYNRVIEKLEGKYPNCRWRIISRPCLHCNSGFTSPLSFMKVREEMRRRAKKMGVTESIDYNTLRGEKPPCVAVCPTGASHKRPDGIVGITYERCIGCRLCLVACPYGARYFDRGDFRTKNIALGEIAPYEASGFEEYGRIYERKPKFFPWPNSPIGNARKCQFCLHKIYRGELPACVLKCQGGARIFGNLNDTESLIHQVLKFNPHLQMKLRPELGTDPTVIYIDEPFEFNLE